MFPRVSRVASAWLVALSAFFDRRMLRGLVPAVVAIVTAPFLAAAVRTELKEPLFEDSLVFQYTGWCIRHGLRLYQDVGMADGPFIHYLHAAIQAVVGVSDRAFRGADLFLHVTGAVVMGAVLARPDDPRRAVRWMHRMAWAATSAGTWLCWYFTFGWVGTTQREGFYGLFGSTGMVLLFGSGWCRPRLAKLMLIAGTVFVASQAFGKPTGVLYPAAGALCVLLPDPSSPIDRGRRARIFLAAIGACVLAVVLTLLVSGSISGYGYWCWKIPYRGNLFLYRTDWLRLGISTYWDPFSRVLTLAVVTGVVSLGAGILPAKALPFVLVPPLAYIAACLQGRGYNYHLMPMAASIQVEMMVILTCLWKRDTEEEHEERRAGAATVLAFAFVGYQAIGLLQGGFRWNGNRAHWDVPDNESVVNERKAGEYIKAHTKVDDWVFAYTPGTAHVILFTAERRTASAFLHAYVLDQIGLLPQSEKRPSPAEYAALKDLQDEDRRRACAGVVKNKPAALAFGSLQDAYAICPPVREMIEKEFTDAATFGLLHVYLRR